MSQPVLVHWARELVHRISNEIKFEYGLSSMAPSIYDTAWLALVPDRRVGQNRWLFPESFTYLLEHQNPDGGWDTLEQSTRVAKYSDSLWQPDCIIHSLAALLALCQHFRLAACQGSGLPEDALARIFRAKRFLDKKLSAWVLEGTAHFGFELLIPVLLQLLSEEGLSFDFPVKEELLTRYEKASSIDLNWLYDGPCQVPLLSLESFIGKLDFSRLEHLVSNGGIIASPASTAAYLIYAPKWSDKCEAFLRHVVTNGQGQGNGAAGGVFPLEIFEPSWVLTALLENGFTAYNLGLDQVDSILRVIHKSLVEGVTGATHVFLPDADDTSRALTTLNLQGYQISPKGLVDKFEVSHCFETFDSRMPNRVTSVSVNANVLSSFLHGPDPSVFTAQIEKIARFICSQWQAPGRLEDHWNMSEYYGIMHMAQSLILLLVKQAQGALPSISVVSYGLIHDTIPSCLREVLDYLLKNQHEDGSWGQLHCNEETAYAIVALANLGSHLSVVGGNDWKVDLAIAWGKQFLLEHWVPGNKNPDRVWTGKVLHGLVYVGEAYILAALKVNRVNLAGVRGVHPD
ncbi:terpenoid cyclases/protein prenyltransferase alpha-alpha toroid [Aspergillus bertholletiae]|uniref:Terpenoid cyclases/protein prenyltransferase alpha-alpha toroid n=1 Tax=Aspergillus bertholletiae TaxID=1226010 RepID=A0A5N7B4E0_9EURO|nr:terpenoid cyclases/protein prenyltransferase alpha-alpha toroid [Aspergillus bertholletiae]